MFLRSRTGATDLHRTLFLILIMLSACSLPADREQVRLPLDEDGYAYPFKVLHRLPGTARIPWAHDPVDCPVEQEIATGLIDQALSRWNQIGSIGFERVSEISEAQLIVRWKDRGDRSSARFGNTESVLAQVVRPEDSGVWQMVLNSSLKWNLGKVEPRSTAVKAAGPRYPKLPDPHLYSVILHEAGHVLGLGHVDHEDSVMQPLQGHTVEVPSAEDRAGIHSLYGSDSPADSNDLQILCKNPTGDLWLAAPILRDLIPENRVRVHVVDLDGDKRDEILLIQSGKASRPGTGLLLLSFDERGLLRETVGPLPAVIDGNLPLCYGRTDTGDGVLAQPMGDGRYRALLFSGGKLPVRPWSPEVSWESRGGGGGDKDGDGVLDHPIQGLKILGKCDIDGDGKPEYLSRGDR
ncbi:hypothetical protein CBD41_05110 [bacterium TMED181]|nr:hypothetical protein [Planctomycetota bacterium]OUW44770.1 MAG: hypothetical protein CBD41_05110 [bacterium TMED181]